MELFSLLAKLTLDSKEFEKGISEAQSAGKDINIADPELGLDKSEFDAGIEEAENTDVENPDDPELGLDKEDFDSGIEDAESTEVEDPESPSLGLDTSEFNDNLNEGETNAGLFGESLGSIFKDLSGILTATGIVAAVAGIVGSLKEGVELAKNTGDAIHKQSAFMGLTTKAYQEWDYALNLSGASVTDLTRGMRNFQQIMAGDATDKQADALEKLGINMDEVTDAEDLMTKSMYALADYTGSDKDWIAKQLFGNNYTKFARLLEGGSEGIKAMREEAEGLGFVMTDEEIQNAADYMDATTRLDKAIEGLKTSLVKDILPILTDITNRIAYIVAFFSGRSNNDLAGQMKEVDKEFTLSMATIQGTGEVAMQMVDKLYSLGDAEKMTAEQEQEWRATAEWLIENIPDLSDKIDIDTLSLKGNREEIQAVIDKWKEYSMERAIAEAREKKYQLLLEKESEYIDKRAEADAKYMDFQRDRSAAISIVNDFLAQDTELSNAIADSIEEKYGRRYITGEEEEDYIHTIGMLTGKYDEIKQLLGSAGSNLLQAMKLGKEADELEKQVKEEQEKYEKWSEALETRYKDIINGTDEANKSIEGEITTVNSLIDTINNVPTDKTTTFHVEYDDPRYDDRGFYHSYAIGNSYIPYDQMALLHRGEQVVTATEVRRNNNQVQISTDFENRVIAAIREGMADANVTAIVTDRQVARGSNRFNGNELDSRRFVP